MTSLFCLVIVFEFVEGVEVSTRWLLGLRGNVKSYDSPSSERLLFDPRKLNLLAIML